MSYPVQTIVDFFVAFTEYNDETISDDHLQWLLCYAQGYYLATHDEPLFDAAVVANRSGNYVPAVNLELLRGSTGDRVLPRNSAFTWTTIQDDLTVQFLIRIYNAFGPADSLRLMHDGDEPWLALSNGATVQIPQSTLRDYFANAMKVEAEWQ
jgi:uncharacterized phage-associated protein